MKKILTSLMVIAAVVMSSSFAFAITDRDVPDKSSHETADKSSHEAPDKSSHEAPDKPDHCKEASDRVKEAADHFGHGDFGTAAEKIGEAAGAARECLRDKSR